MLKIALLDRVVNEKCCSVDGGRGICPLFSSPPRGIEQLKIPTTGNLPYKAKANAWWLACMLGGGGGVGLVAARVD